MTVSPEFTNDSSFNWSASYRLDSEGLASVRPLPGQTELANYNAGLRGINFQSHAHGPHNAPYHSEPGVQPLQTRLQQVQGEYQARSGE